MTNLFEKRRELLKNLLILATISVVVLILVYGLKFYYSSESYQNIESESYLSDFSYSGFKEGISPSDWIKRNETFVYLHHVIIQKDLSLSAIKGTNSMLPVLNKDTHVLLLPVNNDTKLKEGDIVIFTNKYNESIIHRLISIENEVYITKGDNNDIEDEPIRREDIKFVTAGILY